MLYYLPFGRKCIFVVTKDFLILIFTVVFSCVGNNGKWF